MGLLSLVSALLFYSATRKTGFSILFGIWGLGSLIAGAVPETLLSVHEVGSLAAFMAGSVAAMVAFGFFSAPLKYFSLALGVISFASLIPVTFDGPFYRWNNIFGLGLGGIERMVVYPIHHLGDRLRCVSHEWCALHGAWETSTICGLMRSAATARSMEAVSASMRVVRPHA